MALVFTPAVPMLAFCSERPKSNRKDRESMAAYEAGLSVLSSVPFFMPYAVPAMPLLNALPPSASNP